MERGALDTAAWYLAERAWKRRCAWALRAGTAAGALTGAALPLLDLTGVADGCAPWGYLALLLGVACVAGDRFFGTTSGWMRDVATAQAVQRRLRAFQFDWASECVREVLGPADGTASEAAERCLSVLRRFSEDVTELVRVETADWMVEFRAGGAPLGVLTAVAGSGRPETALPHGRFPAPRGRPAPTCPVSARPSPAERCGPDARFHGLRGPARQVAVGADHVLAVAARESGGRRGRWSASCRSRCAAAPCVQSLV
ncbi:SLATT domain-containing protein [Streptomyces sp. KM77-8]|uniref:SLATT domain-containing protein n=1 Tax=Streptomyces haneummycinicus TaxID=3074435 RepID=A0AAT9H926_9ACTN